MTEEKAKMVAEVTGGNFYQSGGGVWLVTVQRKDKFIVISDEVICEYESEEYFQNGYNPINCINLV